MCKKNSLDIPSTSNFAVTIFLRNDYSLRDIEVGLYSKFLVGKNSQGKPCDIDCCFAVVCDKCLENSAEDLKSNEYMSNLCQGS